MQPLRPDLAAFTFAGFAAKANGNPHASRYIIHWNAYHAGWPAALAREGARRGASAAYPLRESLEALAAQVEGDARAAARGAVDAHVVP